MYEDFQSQIARAKELLNELESTCNNDLKSKKVSSKTKNLTQEVLIKIRHLLDQVMYKYFEKYYLPLISESEKKSAKIYFPIVLKKEDLRSVLGRAKMASLEEKHHEFFSFLDSIQPYNQEYLWLKQLADFASEKHIRLTPQTKIEEKRVTVSRSGGSVSWGSGVIFGNGVSVMGVPIDPKTQMPVQNNYTQTKVDIWVSFIFEGTDVNALGLCKKSVVDGEKIIKKIFEFL